MWFGDGFWCWWLREDPERSRLVCVKCARVAVVEAVVARTWPWVERGEACS